MELVGFHKSSNLTLLPRPLQSAGTEVKLLGGELAQTRVGSGGVLQGQHVGGRREASAPRPPREPGAQVAPDLRRPAFHPQPSHGLGSHPPEQFQFTPSGSGLETDGVQSQAHNLPPPQRLQGKLSLASSRTSPPGRPCAGPRPANTVLGGVDVCIKLCPSLLELSWEKLLTFGSLCFHI